MRKLIMDGFVGTIGSDDPSWLLPYYDDELTAYVVDLLSSAGVHAMGRPAYEDMGPYWQASNEPFATPMNEIPKAVFSSSLREATWPETTIHGERRRGGDAGPQGAAARSSRTVAPASRRR